MRVRFADDQQRAAHAVAEEVEALIPLIPRGVITHMLGGERGMSQVPDPERRHAQIKRILSERAGTDGSSVAQVRLMLRDVREYGAKNFHLAGDALDAACFPMSSSLAHELIASAHERATLKGAGSRKGATVGDRLRTTLIFAAEKLLWPIEVPRVALQAAAPKATSIPGKRAKAGVLPIAAKCQLEAIAADPHTHLSHLTWEARAVVTYYARSFLAAGIDHSVRVAEGVRVEIWPDEEEPDTVMRGHAYMAKDGPPTDIYAPAEGFLGRYEWWPEYLRTCLQIGQPFPAWGETKCTRGIITRATGFTGGVALKSKVRQAFKTLLTLPPMEYTIAELKTMNIQGHSGHASPPEWARCIGKNPKFALSLVQPLPEPLKEGFDEGDLDALGHWLRSAKAKEDAAAAAAAAAALPSQARREAAIASLQTKKSTKVKMQNYYGTAGSAHNRFSERWTQLRVRQRLAHTVRALLEGRDWQKLERGQADLQILRSV